jgi:hypothetical protein
MELITLSIAGSTLVFIGQSCSLLHDHFFADKSPLETSEQPLQSQD